MITIRIDASAIKESSCKRRLFLLSQGWTEKGATTNDLVYGSAVHAGIENYYHNKDDNAARLAAISYWNNVKEMAVKENKKHLDEGHLIITMAAILRAMKTLPLFTSLKPVIIGNNILVEQKFSIPVYQDSEYKVLLQGTIDLIGLIEGKLAIVDWKTTSAYNPDDYFKQYKMSVQLRTYHWALLELARLYPDGEFAKLITSHKRIQSLIVAFFLKTTAGVEIKASPIERFTEYDLAEYYSMLQKLVRDLIEDHKQYNKSNIFPPPDGIMNNSCVTPFNGMCKFYKICSSTVSLSTGDRNTLLQSFLHSRMQKKEYRPLRFGGEGKISSPKKGEEK